MKNVFMESDASEALSSSSAIHDILHAQLNSTWKKQKGFVIPVIQLIHCQKLNQILWWLKTMTEHDSNLQNWRFIY